MAADTVSLPENMYDNAERFPNFIIGGAPKCGTTSLHFILDQHPEIGLPEAEIHYFDADDPVTHSDFLRTENGTLKWYDPAADVAETRAWYASRFAPFAKKPLIGEDSTTYIFSAVAAHRIKAMLPDVKLVFMLRNPVRRAYSQYWHMMNSARTSLTFEQALSRFPNILLGSTYTENLKRFYELFPAKQIKVVIFEEFVADQQAAMDEITDFLGAARMQVDPQKAWFNRTKYTRNASTQRLLNRIGRPIVRGRYRSHMTDRTRHTLGERVNNKIHHLFFKYAYPPILKADKPPAIDPATQAYLEAHLTLRNRGLSDVLGRDVGRLWSLNV